MSDDWRWLRENETVVWEGRPRLTTIVGSLIAGLVVVAVAVGLAAIVDPRLAALGLLGVPLPVFGYLWVQNITYLVTTRAIWVKTGIVGCSVRRITLSKVQNTAYQQSIRGSLFGYGTVTVDVAGGRDIDFRRISDPQAVQEAINDQLNQDDRREIPGTTEQWQAVLSTIRGIREQIEARSTTAETTDY
jgi:uncharacterized membrane protein YdbT with pleckstrin-like domain